MWGEQLLSALGPAGFPEDLQAFSVTQTSGLSVWNREMSGLELCLDIRNGCLQHSHGIYPRPQP